MIWVLIWGLQTNIKHDMGTHDCLSHFLWAFNFHSYPGVSCNPTSSGTIFRTLSLPKWRHKPVVLMLNNCSENKVGTGTFLEANFNIRNDGKVSNKVLKQCDTDLDQEVSWIESDYFKRADWVYIRTINNSYIAILNVTSLSYYCCSEEKKKTMTAAFHSRVRDRNAEPRLPHGL